MGKSNKKALNKESQQNVFNNSILSEWNQKVKLVFLMIDETENINQLECMKQECKEEGRPHIVAYIDNRIEQLKERWAI